MMILLAYDGSADAQAALRDGALDVAKDGARRATASGLVAESRIANRNGSIADTILAIGADLDVDAIVLGTRRLSGVKSLMLGSVSHAVLHHADRAVLVVPSPGLAEHRHQWVEHAEIAAGLP